MTVGERIRERRTALGVNQTQLADKISVSKQTLYKYETGVITNIPSDKIEKIAETLNTTPEVLMGWKKPENVEMELMADIAGDPELIEVIRKVTKMSKEQKIRVYGFIEGVYSEKKSWGLISPVFYESFCENEQTFR